MATRLRREHLLPRLREGRRPHVLRVHDIRREPVGEFAGPMSPDAPVGTFGNRRVSRWRGNGTFMGDSDRQRQGSFGDIDLGPIDDVGEIA